MQILLEYTNNKKHNVYNSKCENLGNVEILRKAKMLYYVLLKMLLKFSIGMKCFT